MRVAGTSLVLILSLSGCSEAMMMGDAASRGDADTAAAPADEAPGWSGGGADFDTGGLPSEDQSDRYRLRPAQTDAYVFIANPDRDTVTRVHVATQAVRTVRVGRQPSVVAVTDDWSRAVVLNKGDDSVSVLTADTLEQQVVPVRDNMNALALAPDGRWAVLWHDVAARRPDDPRPGPATSYNEVSLVSVDGLYHVPLVVGFNPKSVRFADGGAIALVVADASLAVLRLDQDTPVPEYIRIADPLSPPVAEEVLVAPGGRYAFVRQRANDVLTVVDLETGEVESIPVGANPTDLDLTPDRRGLAVVSRGAREVAVFSVDAPLDPPHVVPFGADEPLGSVIMGPNDTAILYTTTGATSRYATWDLLTDEVVLRPLAKPAASISRTPTGSSLLVVHTAADNADGTTPEPYKGKPAISLVDLHDFRANTIALAEPVSGFQNSDDGRRGYLVMEHQPVLAVLDYTSLIFDAIPLRSEPVFVGVVPDHDPFDADEAPAWVSQRHPLGRLSFYDPHDGELETITGFELNAGIEE